MRRRSIDACYVGGGRALTRTRDGHLMYVVAHDLSLAPWLLLDGRWEPQTTAVYRRLVRPGDTVVEVGANVGYFTLLAAAAAGPRGSVHAFEPDPELFALLRDNVEINGYDGRVRLWPCALADAPGRARFFATQRHRGNGSLVERLDQLGDASAETRAIDVDVATLDACDVGVPDVLKIDAEGAEARVFRGARATLAAARDLRAVVEFWPRFFQRAGDDARAFLEERRSDGFRLERIDRRGRRVRATVDELLTRGPSELVLARGARWRR